MHRLSRLTAFGASLAIAVAGAGLLAACNSVLGLEGFDVGVACGKGTKLVNGVCEATTISFSGVTGVSPVTPTSLLVQWDPAASTKTSADQISYSVYVGFTPGGEAFDTPAGTGPMKGGTSYLLDGLTPGADVYVVVRATDASGQESNRVELHAKAQADTKAPAFAGVETAEPADGGRVKLGWKRAEDDLSASAAITYRVFFDQKTPVTGAANVAASVRGETSIEVLLPKPGTPYHFIVRAEDASGNQDDNAIEVVSAAGPDSAAPTFGGCAAAMATASNEIHVSWSPGHDEVTPAQDLWYDVYAFTSPGDEPNLGAAVAHRSIQGQTSVDVGGLEADTSYSFVCLARDLSGNQSDNVADVMTKTGKDVLAPTFAGAASATPLKDLHGYETYEIEIAWPAASDLQTPADEIVYEVYASKDPGGEDFNLPPAAMIEGASSTTLLVPSGARTYLVVLARDAAGNADTAVPEIFVDTHISYDWQIQPLFNKSCVTGCHASAQTDFNPILFASYSWTFIQAEALIVPYNPAASPLYQNVSCAQTGGCIPPGQPGDPHQMPPPNATPPGPLPPEDVELLLDWITQGAPGPLDPPLGAPPVL